MNRADLRHPGAYAMAHNVTRRDDVAPLMARLADLARMAGWVFQTHHTGGGAQSALLWAYRALEGGR